jgi:hypothetical protein
VLPLHRLAVWMEFGPPPSLRQDAPTVSFGRGALFEDPEGLLGGAGKTSRTLKLRAVTDLERASIRTFIRQVVDHS